MFEFRRLIPGTGERAAGDAPAWRASVERIGRMLSGMRATRHDLDLDADAAMAVWLDLTLAVRRAGRVIYLIGNGASASMASHISADLAKNGRLHTQVFTDLSLITAMANDNGYENVYAVPLGDRMRPGDMLVAISSSGNSPNIVAGVRRAASLGCETVTLTAMGEDNLLRRLGSLALWVPAETYGMAETCHAAVLHHWVDRVVESADR